MNDEHSFDPQTVFKTLQAQAELIQLLENQIMDLTMMSKIELGDDVIEEIQRLKQNTFCS